MLTRPRATGVSSPRYPSPRFLVSLLGPPRIPTPRGLQRAKSRFTTVPSRHIKVIGTLSAEAGGTILEYHPHWCKLDLEASGLGKNWIAQAHLKNCPPEVAVPGAPIGKLVEAKNDVNIYDRPKKPRKVIGMMRDGETAKVVDVDFAWWQLDLPKTDDVDGGKGWIASNHLKVK